MVTNIIIKFVKLVTFEPVESLHILATSTICLSFDSCHRAPEANIRRAGHSMESYPGMERRGILKRDLDLYVNIYSLSKKLY